MLLVMRPCCVLKQKKDFIEQEYKMLKLSFPKT